MATQQAISTRSLTVAAANAQGVPPPKNPDLRLPFGSVVRSAISGRQYRVGEVLGTGGFGAVYRITHITGGKPLSGKCVLKVTLEVGAWHREAYFGELLRETAGIVQVHESFAWVQRGNEPKPLYCLVSEFVEGGDLIHYLQEHSEAWSEWKARREIVRLLGPLRLLHAAGLVHRDITPRNVFVTAGRELKLGDFGIAAQRLGKQEAKANAFAPWFAPTSIKEGKTRAWLPADDVYHLGKLFALLLHGREKARLTPGHVKTLACSAWAKAVIQRCIGQRRRRFANATEMLKALERPKPDDSARRSVVRSLQGKRVVFTGRLKMLRKKAANLLVRQAGGISQAKVSRTTDILVVGEQSPHWKAEKKGQKLLDLDHEREHGHRIAVITEKRFQTLIRLARGDRISGSHE
ncbi:MAG TPA: protein kinase [Bryobacteraceae bacterium]|nr:protein kinase [Bryobacteraceae bacterium]